MKQQFLAKKAEITKKRGDGTSTSTAAPNTSRILNAAGASSSFTQSITTEGPSNAVAPTSAVPDDITIEKTLRALVHSADGIFTLRGIRNAAEIQLGLDEGFFKTEQWKERSKQLIHQAAAGSPAASTPGISPDAIELGLRGIARNVYASKEEVVTHKMIYAAAEKALALKPGFFTSEPGWKERSKNIIEEVLDESPESPTTENDGPDDAIIKSTFLRIARASFKGGNVPPVADLRSGVEHRLNLPDGFLSGAGWKKWTMATWQEVNNEGNGALAVPPDADAAQASTSDPLASITIADGPDAAKLRKARKCRYLPIADSHPTIVRVPQADGGYHYVELRCDICDGNFSASLGKFFASPLAFASHIRAGHPTRLGAGGLSVDDIIKRREHHVLTDAEADSILNGMFSISLADTSWLLTQCIDSDVITTRLLNANECGTGGAAESYVVQPHVAASEKARKTASGAVKRTRATKAPAAERTGVYGPQDAEDEEDELRVKRRGRGLNPHRTQQPEPVVLKKPRKAAQMSSLR